MGRRVALAALCVALALCGGLAIVLGSSASALPRGADGEVCPHDTPGRPCGMPDPPGRGCGIPSPPGPGREHTGGVGKTCGSTVVPPPTATTVPTTTTPPTTAAPIPTTTSAPVPTTAAPPPAPTPALVPVPESSTTTTTTTTTTRVATTQVEQEEVEAAIPVEEPAEVLGVVQRPRVVDPDEPAPEPPRDDLSDVSTGIPTTVDFTPSFIASNVGFGALLVLVLVAASQLFNDALKMHHDRIATSLTGRSTLLAGAGSMIGRLPRVHPLVTFALAAGTLGLLADPSVSMNVATIGQILGMAVGLGVIVAVYEIPAARRIERESGQHEAFRLFPIAIVIAIACLLFSRIFDVAPGVLYGLFAGVLFTSVDTKIAGRAYARSSVLLAGAAMGAWGIHRLIDGAATSESPTIWAVLFDTAAAVIFVGGLQSVIVQLLPMPFTYGESVVKWSRTAWAALFIASLALYMQFVVRPNPDAATWSNLWFVAAFMALALGFWGYCALLRWSDRRKAAAAEAGAEAEADGDANAVPTTGR